MAKGHDKKMSFMIWVKLHQGRQVKISVDRTVRVF